MHFRRLTYSFLALFLTLGMLAQPRKQDTDSLVRLLGCNELLQTEESGRAVRKALGNARFEHNNTLLVCDTALWDVDAKIINAMGHVRIIQNETVLSSEKLNYYIDSDLAEFRGAMVQLQDKKKNTLRTRNLDYNTKDSVAVFRQGGAFRAEDGQVIESDMGSYDSKIKTFSFNGNVNMYTDSLFLKTNNLEYNTNTTIATFGSGTHAWKDENMLSAGAGWYNREQEIFLFYRRVHVMTQNQEAWSDSLKYYRNTQSAELFGNAEVLDTTRNVTAVGGYMSYVDSLQRIVLRKDPAVIAVMEQDGKKDTVYIGADYLVYWTEKRCDIDSAVFKLSETRLKELDQDAVTAYRRKAAEEARKAAEQARMKMLEDDPNAAGAIDRGGKTSLEDLNSAVGTARSGGKAKPMLPAPFDAEEGPVFHEYSFSPAVRSPQLPPPPPTEQRRPPVESVQGGPELPEGLPPQDSLKTNVSDSLAIADSLANIPKDTSKVGFVIGIGNVRIFKSDMQVACDSLEYNDIDSLVRLYKEPFVWNEIRRQYTADSITVIIKNQNVDKASLMSNAFITVQEDTACYDQIKSTEMMAYFDTTGALRRFDALGGASGVFFIEENDALATVNKFEAKMLTATFVEGNLDDLNYFEDVKSDAYPIVQMTREQKFLKGYNWSPEMRPKGPLDVTGYVPRESERSAYEAIPQASFKQTDIYFPGYMKEVHKMLAQQDSIKRVRRAEKKALEAERQHIEDSLALVHAADTLPPVDTLSLAGLSEIEELRDELRDTTARQNVSSSSESEGQGENPEVAKDTTSHLPKSLDIPGLKKDPKEIEREKEKAEKERLRAEEKARKDAIKAEKQAKKERKWAELDARDAEKAAVKAEKALKKQREKTLKTLRAVDKRNAKEQKALEHYMARYQKKKAREDARKAK